MIEVGDVVKEENEVEGEQLRREGTSVFEVGAKGHY